MYRQHVNKNWSFVLKIHLAHTFRLQLFQWGDLCFWEVAYQQYQIWQPEDVDNKTVQFSTNISHYFFFPIFRFLELFINKTMKVLRDILEIFLSMKTAIFSCFDNDTNIVKWMVAKIIHRHSITHMLQPAFQMCVLAVNILFQRHHFLSLFMLSILTISWL